LNEARKVAQCRLIFDLVEPLTSKQPPIGPCLAGVPRSRMLPLGKALTETSPTNRARRHRSRHRDSSDIHNTNVPRFAGNHQLRVEGYHWGPFESFSRRIGDKAWMRQGLSGCCQDFIYKVLVQVHIVDPSLFNFWMRLDARRQTPSERKRISITQCHTKISTKI
jgi:hypothetical protein